ncbi:MAG: hypothetical protein RR937_04745 [Ruthenibacterium sp.]
MKRVCALFLTLCVAACLAQTAFAAVPPDGDETSNHTIVRLWVTDGKNLPDLNENNPTLFVRVVDENGALIPNAAVTLHLMQPMLTDEIVMKSEQNGSTHPTQGAPAAAVAYKVFGPENEGILYIARASADGYCTGATQPFSIGFEVSGTVEICLKKYDAAKDIAITYVVRAKDKADIAFTHANIQKGGAIGSENVPRVTYPTQRPDAWKLDGYYVNGQKYTAEQLAALHLSADTVVEIRMILDNNGDGTDDREGNKPDSGGTNGDSVPKTGVADGYQGYVIGFSVSLILLVLVLAAVLYRAYQDKKEQQTKP